MTLDTVIEAFRTAINNSRVTLQIVVSLTIIIHDRSMSIVHSVVFAITFILTRCNLISDFDAKTSWKCHMSIMSSPMQFISATCFIKPFKAEIKYAWEKARAFVTVSHFRASLIFLGNARSLPLEWCFVRGFNWVSSSLACQY
jgi:hypothetical protein